MFLKRIIVVAAVLVNAAGGVAAHAAAKLPKSDIGQLVKWLQETGKEREDYNGENAPIIGREPGNGKSKARGVPGQSSDSYRIIHLFSKGPKPDFVVIKNGSRDTTLDKFTTYKIMPSGKIAKAFRIESPLDSSGKVVESGVDYKELALDKTTKAAAAGEIAFWLGRAKQEPPAQPAPAAPAGNP